MVLVFYQLTDRGSQRAFPRILAHFRSTMTLFRTQRDSMGEVRLPAEAYYGPQTSEPSTISRFSGRPLAPELIHALGLVKWPPRPSIATSVCSRRRPTRRTSGPAD